MNNATTTDTKLSEEKKTLKDYRLEDMKKLDDVGIEKEWSNLWEESLHKATEIFDENQRLWHLSRLSFLAGFNLKNKGLVAELEGSKEDSNVIGGYSDGWNDALDWFLARLGVEKKRVSDRK